MAGALTSVSLTVTDLILQALLEDLLDTELLLERHFHVFVRAHALSATFSEIFCNLHYCLVKIHVVGGTA